MTDTLPKVTPPLSLSRNQFLHRLKHVSSVAVHHAKKHIGVGIICSVAYFDPGNWGVDLQAGSQFGYRLLFVVLVAGLFAVFLQVQASRLGCVTGLDLASHTRLLFYDRPKHKLLYRWLVLYPLYALSEVAIIATDLSELLGSAIALCLLFPSLSLWQGVLITAFDVIFLLALSDPLGGRPVKAFEVLIGVMVVAVLICMIVIIAKISINWGDAFLGYVPSKFIFAKGGLYTSVGILGATVMPHSLYLGSNLATQDRVSIRSERDIDPSASLSQTSEDSPERTVREKTSTARHCYNKFKKSFLILFQKPPKNSNVATRHSDRQNNSYEFVMAHIYHGTADLVGSLLGFAVLINSLILMLASAVFFYGPNQNNPASLFDAYDLIRNIVGQPAATVFAIALLSSGQSSSIIATLAGQAVAEGFLRWRVSAVVRRLMTRLLAIIPSMAVAIAMGRPGINALLVGSQVVLSIVLPFVTYPLLYCTSKKSIMTVIKSRQESGDPSDCEMPVVGLTTPDADDKSLNEIEIADATTEMVDFSNGKIAVVVGAAIWLVIVAANLYVIVELGLGVGG